MLLKLRTNAETFRNIAAYLKVKFNRLIWNGISNDCTWNENYNNKLKFIVQMNTLMEKKTNFQIETCVCESE